MADASRFRFRIVSNDLDKKKCVDSPYKIIFAHGAIEGRPFIVEPNKNVIYLVPTNETMSLRLNPNILIDFYLRGDTIFALRDKSYQISEKFENYEPILEAIEAGTFKHRGEDDDGDYKPYAKNHLPGEETNNLLLDFDGHMCDHPGYGRTLCKITCITDRNEEITNEVRGQIYLDELMKIYGSGSYIIVACRNCPTTEIAKLARARSDGSGVVHGPVVPPGWFRKEGKWFDPSATSKYYKKYIKYKLKYLSLKNLKK